jgi:nucleoside-diphosphate-sugar epimerase
MTTPPSTTAQVVVGAGAVGTATARLLADRGHPVRLVTRSGGGPEHPLIERVAADASDADRLTTITTGAATLYNCANPAYHRWATDWPPLAAAMLVAAERTGAVLATTSNLYGYGPATMPMTEQTPLAATLTKGRVRAEMWQAALSAHQAGRARVTEVRGSDYLGPTDQSVLYSRAVPAALAGRTARVLGDPDAAHTWTYPPDVARLLVTVAADERGWGRAWHVPSQDPRSARQVVADFCRAAGVPDVAVARIPSWVIRVGGVFSPLLRQLPEVAYQHDRPFVMDSSAARNAFGLEPTGWNDIIQATLAPLLAERRQNRAA